MLGKNPVASNMQVHGVANAMTLSKLKEELLWLEKVEVPSCPCPSSQIMLADHLQHCREHFACAGVDKIELGEKEVMFEG